ncbi:MAG: hypothetical protein KDC92_11170, partial [Bacteroidetes bacterium]|nr:hypothetical protein [Bacteroidota bacterium]
MKNSNLLFLLVLVCCGAIITSCGKDDGPEGPDGTEPVVKINTIPEFYPKAVEANYGTTPPEYTVLLDRLDGVLSPNDLEFNPDPDRPNELWVLNPGTERTGASTVIVHGAGTSDQEAEYRIDGNAWHFMALATSLAFGDNGNFATSQGILDANRGYIPGVNFTGPTLWTADLNIYAVVGNPVTPTVNGSHLDMIHQ